MAGCQPYHAAIDIASAVITKLLIRQGVKGTGK
jgi:hypothetical protein